jgi:hypothetical protein
VYSSFEIAVEPESALKIRCDVRNAKKSAAYCITEEHSRADSKLLPGLAKIDITEVDEAQLLIRGNSWNL